MLSKEIRIVISNISASTGVSKGVLKNKARDLKRIGYNDKRICDWFWTWKKRQKK
jgi:hypothetical protein